MARTREQEAVLNVVRRIAGHIVERRQAAQFSEERAARHARRRDAELVAFAMGGPPPGAQFSEQADHLAEKIGSAAEVDQKDMVAVEADKLADEAAASPVIERMLRIVARLPAKLRADFFAFATKRAEAAEHTVEISRLALLGAAPEKRDDPAGLLAADLTKKAKDGGLRSLLELYAVLPSDDREVVVAEAESQRHGAIESARIAQALKTGTIREEGGEAVAW